MFKKNLFDSGFGGVFNYEDIIYAMRLSSTNKDIVWRFKLIINSEPNAVNGHTFKVTQMEAIDMSVLFPDFSSDYFETGFAITKVDECSDSSDVCKQTERMKNLTVLIGPFKTSGQEYKVYRFNGQTFDPIEANDEGLTYRLNANGFTDKWFDPSDALTTAFSSETNDLIVLNNKNIFNLHIGKYKDIPIRNNLFNNYSSLSGLESEYYRLLEVRTQTNIANHFKNNMFLITPEFVYTFTNGSEKPKEFETNWKFFGCDQSLNTSNKSLGFTSTEAKVKAFELSESSLNNTTLRPEEEVIEVIESKNEVSELAALKNKSINDQSSQSFQSLSVVLITESEEDSTNANTESTGTETGAANQVQNWPKEIDLKAEDYKMFVIISLVFANLVAIGLIVGFYIFPIYKLLSLN